MPAAGKFAWYGTHQLFQPVSLIFRETEYGVFIAHAYQYSDRLSTFLVEVDPDTWHRAGLDTATEEESRAFCEQVFAEDLGGHSLLGNRSNWFQASVVRNERWSHGKVVILPSSASLPPYPRRMVAVDGGVGASVLRRAARADDRRLSLWPGMLLTVMFCGFSLGSALGGVVTAYLIEHVGWRGVLALGGALPLALVPVLALALPESVRYLATRDGMQARIAAILSRIDAGRISPDARYVADEPDGTTSPVSQLFAARYRQGTLWLWLAFFCSLLLLYLMINWLPILVQRSGLSLKEASMLAGLLQGGGVVGAVVLGVLLDRFNPYAVVAGAYTLGAIAVACLASVSAPMAMDSGHLRHRLLRQRITGLRQCAGLRVLSDSSRATGVAWALGIGRVGAIAGSLGGAWLLAAGWSNAALYLLLAIPAVVAAIGIYQTGRVQLALCPGS